MATAKGWTMDTLMRLGVGFDAGRYTIPTATGVLRYRDHEGQGPKMLAPAGSVRELWPAPEDQAGDMIVVVEGEPDGISAHELGYPATALPGAGKVGKDWAKRLAMGRRRVVFVCDSDAVGRARMRGMAEKVAALGVEANVIDLAPERDDGYDLGDLLVELGPVGARDRLEDHMAVAAPFMREAVVVPAPKASDERVAVWTRASDVEIQPVKFLYRPWLPLGKVTILAGAPGQGKSQLTAFFAAATTRGAFDPTDVAEPGTAVLMTAEDDLTDTVVPRLLAAGADLRRVEFINMRRTLPNNLTTDGLIKLPGDVDTLHERFKSGDVRLAVLDPVASFVGREHSTYVNQDVRDTLDPLVTLAARYRVAIVLVLHLNKSEAKTWALKIGESHAFQAVARTVLALAPDPDDEDGDAGVDKILAATKLNITRSGRAHAIRLRVQSATVYDTFGTPVETSTISIMGASSIAADDLLADQTERGSRRQALDFLLNVLAAGPMESKPLQRAAKDAGVSWRSVERYYREVCNPAKPAMSRGPWVYSLQSNHLPVPTPGGHGELEAMSAKSATGMNGKPAGTDQLTGDLANGAEQLGGLGALDLEAYRRERDRRLGERDDD
jgi:putative DNA primase/helicase